jgi:hypothetical protein
MTFHTVDTTSVSATWKLAAKPLRTSLSGG